MAKGISVHVGVNVTTAPEISVPALAGCENDAEAMRRLARSRNFVAVDDNPQNDVALVKDDATFENVLGKIRLAAEKLEAGDIFLFTFSGHGTRRGAADDGEDDDKDETVVLRDRLLVDNILRKHLWPTFKAGVRVVMVSDSCHSGTVSMSAPDDSDEESASAWTNSGRRGPVLHRGETRKISQTGFGIRSIPLDQAHAHFNLLADFYNELRDGLPNPPKKIEASVLLLAACQDKETTQDGHPHGVFTQALLDVWNTNGSKTYTQLMDGIHQRLKELGAESNPVIFPAGEARPAFAETEAFKI